jgi:glycosyltransferase involved in cell wall biosynthesis
VAFNVLRASRALILSCTLQSSPTISCVTCVYNAGPYIDETVQSILAQTFADFEHILIDDGSTDDSLARLRRYEAADRRIRLISRENRGIVASANEGLSLARGEFLARIDSDDVAAPTRFQKQLDFLRTHPECVAVGSRLQMIDPYGSPLGVSDHKLTHDEIECELLSGSGWALSQPAVMMRRESVTRLGGYRKQYECSEDLDLSLRLAEIGQLANLAEPLTSWRRHLASVNHTRHAQQDRNADGIIRETLKRRGLPVPDQLNLNRWRPLPAAEQLRQWAWAALKVGNVRIARKHATNMLRMKPLSLESWRLIYCALRGR